jgi:hypothetical protein
VNAKLSRFDLLGFKIMPSYGYITKKLNTVNDVHVLLLSVVCINFLFLSIILLHEKPVTLSFLYRQKLMMSFECWF